MQLKESRVENIPAGEMETPKRYRGRAELDAEHCLACGICSHVCAGGAISMRETEDGRGVEFRLWHNTCTFCGLCAHYCPTKALKMTSDWSLSHEQSEKFSCCEVKFIRFPVCRECGKSMLPLLKSNLAKGNVGAFDASEVMSLCTECRRKIAASQKISSNYSMTEKKR